MNLRRTAIETVQKLNIGRQWICSEISESIDNTFDSYDFAQHKRKRVAVACLLSVVFLFTPFEFVGWKTNWAKINAWKIESSAVPFIWLPLFYQVPRITDSNTSKIKWFIAYSEIANCLWFSALAKWDRPGRWIDFAYKWFIWNWKLYIMGRCRSFTPR